MDGRRAELWARGSPRSHQRSSAMADVPGTRSTRHVSISCGGVRSETGIVIHRRSGLEDDVTRCSGIPVTTPIRTLLGIATPLPMPALEAAVNEADKLNLVDPERLRADLETPSGQHGVRPLRALLDRATFTLTDSELERRFLRIARRAGLPKPRTQARVNGFRVDFYWPELGLVVETDGLRYHRTPEPTDARSRSRPGSRRCWARPPALHALAGAPRSGIRPGHSRSGGGSRPSSFLHLRYVMAYLDCQTVRAAGSVSVGQSRNGGESTGAGGMPTASRRGPSSTPRRRVFESGSVSAAASRSRCRSRRSSFGRRG
jgi:hypothetical protein